MFKMNFLLFAWKDKFQATCQLKTNQFWLVDAECRGCVHPREMFGVIGVWCGWAGSGRLNCWVPSFLFLFLSFIFYINVNVKNLSSQLQLIKKMLQKMVKKKKMKRRNQNPWKLNRKVSYGFKTAEFCLSFHKYVIPYSFNSVQWRGRRRWRTLLSLVQCFCVGVFIQAIRV